ncbi:MAG: hypothetical protein QW356_04480 [Candidatus Hadarchaeales archaeon]
MRFRLFVFEVDPGRKSLFYKKLSGRTVRSGGRDYRYEGLLSEIQGWRWLAKSALLVPEEAAGRVRDFLRGFGGVTFEEFVLIPVEQSSSPETEKVEF